jgi:iron-sulfur cluster repair protein YtfE (RIC family)
MENIKSLIEEHAALRRLMKGIESVIGAQRGVGWDDQAFCEMAALRAAQQRFHDELKDHEIKEERLIDAMLRDCPAERTALEASIRRTHVSLEGMTALLGTLSGICDGTHVYAVRTMAERLREDLEAHLKYEEDVLFPYLARRRSAGAPAQ